MDRTTTRRLVGAGALVAGLTLSACSTTGGDDATDTTAKNATTTVATTERTTTEATTSTTSAADAVGHVYRNVQQSYAIGVPASWRGPVTKSDVNYWYVGDPQNSFQPNVNVLVQPSGGQGLNRYVSATASSLSSVLDNPNMVVSSVSTRDDGVEIAKMTYTGSSSGVDLEFYATVIESGDQFVLATFTSPADRFSDLIGDVRPGMDSLSPI